MFGTSIKYAIKLDSTLPALVAAAALEQACHVGFFFDEVCEVWDYWTTDTPDASASNCYYTPLECRALLIENGLSD